MKESKVLTHRRVRSHSKRRRGRKFETRAQRAVAASGTCAERQNGKKKPEGKSPVQKMRGPGLESGTKQTQNRPKWLLEEERVPGVGCETFFREEKQQKRPKCREEIERIDLCDWGKPTFLGKSPNWRLQDLVYQNIPKPTKDWSKRSYKNTMGGDGSFRRGQESEKQRRTAANVLEKKSMSGENPTLLSAEMRITCFQRVIKR